jgi:gliding motility-associated-like protein
VRFLLLIFVIFSFQQISWGQDEIWIKPNRGQWHSNIQFKIAIPGGDMFLEQNGFTYNYNNLGEIYDHAHGNSAEEKKYKGHAVKTHFIGSKTDIVFNESNPSTHYENYIIGNDSTKWVDHLYLFNEIEYLNLYDGINLRVYQKNATLKYDVIVAPNSDPSLFKEYYEGQDNIEIKDGDLIITTSLGIITEKKPFAYQLINGTKRKVECHYVLNNNIMTFDFPNGYDSTNTLIIDPELVFSSFTGSTADNWGMTSCPDVNKNLIAGGIVFSSGYPTTSGAYSSTSSNPNYTGYPGKVELGITKFNATGTGLIFSTYIGGNESETPHSIIVNDQNELYILGATSSDNFPTSSNAFQTTNKLGGGIFNFDGIDFSNGVDIFIFKLSANGSSMLASTLIGGINSDGITATNLTSINYNYGDHLRGEIKLDANSNVYVSSNTNSSDFPIVGGFDNTLDGAQDGVVFKMNPNLTTLMWSTYIGGTGLESGNALTLNSNGDIYVVGGTTSSDLPNTNGQLNSNFLGGTTDGYIAKFSAPSYSNPKFTYVGTNEYDQTYFIDTDVDDYVYIYGQSEGNYPISGSVYSNANSGQFIHKLNTDLTSTIWSTVFGAGTGHVEISPTAFLVSDCYEIYIAGWGGQLNVTNGSAFFSTTNGFPITSDAYQSQTSGSNFYLALFTQNMGSLKYSTYMGSLTGSNDHVDGGTSRFDKTGKVYHAVCAACGGNPNGFPTTPGVNSTTNNSNNCNLAAFLFDVSKIEATLSTATPITCLPNATIFENNSQNGNAYFWDFGDGSTSTDFAPTHQYANPGTYDVMLIVSDIEGCYESDTSYTQVEAILPDYQVWALSDTICPGTSVQVFATGGNGYSWGSPELFDDPTSASPFVTLTEETTITVDITSECGSSQLEITIYVFGVDAESGEDVAICVGDSIQLNAAGGTSYHWTPENTLNNPNIGNPWATPNITTYYYVEIITPEGCHIFDTTKVQVDQDIPYPNLIDEVNICKGDSIQITANGATDYLWIPNYNISDNSIYNPFVYPSIDTAYRVEFTNACGTSYDTVQVNVIEVIGTINPDTIICPEGTATLWASGGVNYDWTPSIHLNKPHDSITFATPNQPMNYSVQITDEYGCYTILTTYIDLFESPTITVSSNIYGIVGDTVEIWAEGNGSILWSPVQYISCTTCPSTYVSPPNNYTYTATLTDNNTCTATGDVQIIFDPLIYVPNAFTPDGDTYNNNFYAVINNVSEFKMYIFNRWGELIFIANSVDQQWDGTYNGNKCLDDVYVWKIKYRDLNGIDYELIGHVTLLR